MEELLQKIREDPRCKDIPIMDSINVLMALLRLDEEYWDAFLEHILNDGGMK